MTDPHLVTTRLLLRPLDIREAAAICDYFTRNAARFERWDPPRSRDVATYERWIGDLRAAARNDGHASHFAGYLIDGGPSGEVPVATVALTSFDRSEPGATISYTLDRALEGRGYASEAVGGVARYAFEALGLRSVTAYVDPENARSTALVRRLHFTEVARLPPLPGPAGILRSQVLWRLAAPASS